MFPSSEIQYLSDYRLSVIDAYFENPKQYGSPGNQMSTVKSDQDRVDTHMEHFGEDMNTVWTEYFPRTYYNLIDTKSKAQFRREIAGFINFDPENERLFKESKTNRLYVVPKLKREYIKRKGSDLPVFCSYTCTEIKYDFKKK